MGKNDDGLMPSPIKAWLQVPVLLPGEKTSTRIEPARSLYAQIPEVEALEGVIDASIWVGYAWADEPRCQAAVVVSGDDAALVKESAERLARAYWDARDQFVFVADALPLAESLDAALLEGAPRPYVVSDSGDNPTAGGAGDVSWTLGELLSRPEFSQNKATVVHASIFDEVAVAQCVAAGVGGSVRLQVGAKVDAGPRGPVDVEGTVFSITDRDKDAGTQVVVKSSGVYAIITERRKPFHHIHDFTMLGINPLEMDVICVKIGYLEPELYDLAAGWKLGLTPGGVEQRVQILKHFTHPQLCAGQPQGGQPCGVQRMIDFTGVL